MKKIGIKVCGMKSNCDQVVSLAPDYVGFIFYGKSPRYWEGELPEIPQHIGRVGVFVNATVTTIKDITMRYGLAVIQLHGDETPEFCKALRNEILQHYEQKIELWKVFAIKNTIHWEDILPYEKVADKYLFDTKGDSRGGNGETFDWSLLKTYPSEKPFILSGGIGQEHLKLIREINSSKLPLYAVDVNSRFEHAPGRKNIATLKKFIDELSY
ncbi:phosphoribosylanthranilate isomerase [Altibacter sp.]|uniref:phosphoribosylanthranilate isomerase n=1 Tax=Altibacter sp. TaxID=2024823 RepID=UPI000C99161D|nr:phosphoribosylanthranilate isomerase [Altibacter sp.]MAP53555.1 N-(5'-phosphoribosyl)anthranilate isomerase [Altibacter sp.]